jgi:two-component sensor histidine kinase
MARGLELTWAEHGGPPVEEPRRKGYGSQILQGVLAHDINASVIVNYKVSGLVAVIKLKDVIALPEQWSITEPQVAS